MTPSPPAFPPVATAFGDWPTYDQNLPRDGYQGLERTLSPRNASLLTQLFNFTTNGPPEGSVAVVNTANGTGTAYFGDWAGYVYAMNATNNHTYWTDSPNVTLIGNHGTATCNLGTNSYPVDGVTSTPAVWGRNLYVASQNFLYDLDTATGHVLWNVSLSWLGDQPSGSGDGYWQAHYVWSSPIVYNNYVYVGMASGCDNPLVRGQLFQIPMNGTNVSAGPVHIFNVTLTTSFGGSIWSSPSIDALGHTIWITTGNGNTAKNGNRTTPTYNQALVALDANNISRVKGYFTDLNTCKLNDCDFGAGPTLFNSSSGILMVAAMSKDGNTYAFNRSAFVGNVSVTKPAWTDAINYKYSYAPAAFDGSRVFIGGGLVNITLPNGTVKSFNGSVRAVNPSTGTLLWPAVHLTRGYVGAGVVAADGLVVDTSIWLGSHPGSTLEVLNASSGALLYSYNTTYQMNAEPAIFDGRIYVEAAPNHFAGHGKLLVFGISPTAGLSSITPSFTTIPQCPIVNGVATPTGGMPAFNFSWNWGDNTSLSFGSNPTHKYCVTGTFTAKMTMIDAAGWTALTEWSVTDHITTCSGRGGLFWSCWLVTATHCVPVSGPFGLGCFPLMVQPATSYFGAYAVNGTGTLSWAWNFGDGSQVATSEFPSHTYQSQGTYTVTLTITDEAHHQLVDTYLLKA